jgi:hypothetical protein
VHVPVVQRDGVSRAIRRPTLHETRRAEMSEMRTLPAAVVLPQAAIEARAAAALLGSTRIVDSNHGQRVASTRTGTALNAAFPVITSTTEGSVMSLTLTPAFSAASRHPTPGRACPKPCGIETTPGRIS